MRLNYKRENQRKKEKYCPIKHSYREKKNAI